LIQETRAFARHAPKDIHRRETGVRQMVNKSLRRPTGVINKKRRLQSDGGAPMKETELATRSGFSRGGFFCSGGRFARPGGGCLAFEVTGATASLLDFIVLLAHIAL